VVKIKGSWRWHGCRRTCSEQHTYKWGDCALAPETARPEPHVSMTKVFVADDGNKAIGYDKYTEQQLADLIEPALHWVIIRLGPYALAMLQRGDTVALSAGEYADLAREAAHAIIHRNAAPGVCTRPGHACCQEGAGPCNGLPRTMP
jgi:hypothetical protein